MSEQAGNSTLDVRANYYGPLMALTRTSQNDGSLRRVGWEALEDHFTRHDKAIVDGFNDDINTLLVFVSNSLIRLSSDLTMRCRPVSSLPSFRLSSSCRSRLSSQTTPRRLPTLSCRFSRCYQITRVLPQQPTTSLSAQPRLQCGSTVYGSSASSSAWPPHSLA